MGKSCTQGPRATTDDAQAPIHTRSGSTPIRRHTISEDPDRNPHRPSNRDTRSTGSGILVATWLGKRCTQGGPSRDRTRCPGPNTRTVGLHTDAPTQDIRRFTRRDAMPSDVTPRAMFSNTVEPHMTRTQVVVYCVPLATHGCLPSNPSNDGCVVRRAPCSVANSYT